MIFWSFKNCFGTSNIGSGGIIIDKFIYFKTKIIQNRLNIQKINLKQKSLLFFNFGKQTFMFWGSRGRSWVLTIGIHVEFDFLLHGID